MSAPRTPSPLVNTTAQSAPRSGLVGVLPVDELPDERYTTKLRIAVICPSCSNYGAVEGTGAEYRNITKMIAPEFWCSACSWRPSVGDSPERWNVYYSGRLGGTLLWSVNEEHTEVLIDFLETNPKRRKGVQFGWEYRALMARLPNELTSGRFRNDVVTLLKKLLKTKPRGI